MEWERTTWEDTGSSITLMLTATFAAEINDCPMSLALLKVINTQFCDFVSPQPAHKQER